MPPGFSTLGETPGAGVGIVLLWVHVRRGESDTVYPSRHSTADGRYLPEDVALTRLFEIPAAEAHGLLESMSTGDTAEDPLLPPVEPYQEVRASGATHERSREARGHEPADARVYDAERPEL